MIKVNRIAKDYTEAVLLLSATAWDHTRGTTLGLTTLVDDSRLAALADRFYVGAGGLRNHSTATTAARWVGSRTERQPL